MASLHQRLWIRFGPWLAKVPTWAGLRAIGNSRAVKVSAVFPIVGYLILLSSSVTSLFDGGLAGDGAWGALWSSKLYFVYFGLMSLGIGSAIYQWRCPRQVKKHGDWEDYVRLDGPSMNVEAIYELSAVVTGKVDNRVANHPEQLDHYRSYYLNRFYSMISSEEIVSRAIVAACFTLGFFLLAIPSLMSALKIVAHLILR